MINRVTLVGNVGADPEVKYISEGVATAKINLATSESYTDKKGEKVTKTEWHQVVVWNNLAKTVEKYVKKGMQLYIEGKIAYRSYEKDGVTKYTTEIVANEMKFLGAKRESSEAAPTHSNGQGSHHEQSATDVYSDSDFPPYNGGGSDDLPFN